MPVICFGDTILIASQEVSYTIHLKKVLSIPFNWNPKKDSTKDRKIIAFITLFFYSIAGDNERVSQNALLRDSRQT